MDETSKEYRAKKAREFIDGCKGRSNNLALCVYNHLCDAGIKPQKGLHGYVRQKGLYNNTSAHVYRLIAMNQDDPKNRGYKSDPVYNLLDSLYHSLSVPHETRPELRLKVGELYTRLSFLRKLLKERKMNERVYNELSFIGLEGYLENPARILDIDLTKYANYEREFRRLGETIPSDESWFNKF